MTRSRKARSGRSFYVERTVDDHPEVIAVAPSLDDAIEVGIHMIAQWGDEEALAILIGDEDGPEDTVLRLEDVAVSEIDQWEGVEVVISIDNAGYISAELAAAALAEKAIVVRTDRGDEYSVFVQPGNASTDDLRSVELKTNPPRVYRMQKVVSKLEKDAQPQMLKKGMVVSSPHELVTGTLADYMSSKPTEIFVAIFVDVRNRVVGYTEFGSGAIASVEVHASGILRDALTSGAAAFITAHQHPTGDPTPSEDDRRLWSRLRTAGELVGIPLLDNLVIGEDGKYFSESEEERA